MKQEMTEYEERAHQTRRRRQAAGKYARRRREDKAWALYWRDYSKYRQGLGAQPNADSYFLADSSGHLDASEWAQARFGELKKVAA